MRNSKKAALIALTGALTIGGAFAAFAGNQGTGQWCNGSADHPAGTTWVNAEGQTVSSWWFAVSPDGNSCLANTWHWIKGMDGSIGCYYFDKDGWMVVNGTVDGSKVDESGAYVDASGNKVAGREENIYYTASETFLNNGTSGTEGTAAGGSTGGTDILAMVVNKYWPVSPGRVYLFSDLFIIASVLLIPGKTVNDMVYGYVTMVTFSVTVDWVLLGNKSTVQMLIISSKYKEIADAIVRDMKRGVTALDSTGWYSGNEGKVLLVMCRKYEYNNIVGMVRLIDPKAFISVSSATGVYGEGFDEVRTGLKLKHGKKGVSKKENQEEKI